MCLVADGLVVDQHAVFDQIPLLGWHALVVVAHGAQGTGCVLSATMLTCLLAVVEAGPWLSTFERGEDGTGVVGFVAQHAVQLERVAHGFVDGQAQVVGVEHEVVLAGRYRFGRRVFPWPVWRPAVGILQHIVASCGSLPDPLGPAIFSAARASRYS